MICNRTFQDNVCIRTEKIDLENDTYILELEGQVVESRSLTLDERQIYGPPPLDTNGVIATLLAVSGTVSEQDAANAVGLQPEDLVVEALGWRAVADAIR